MESLNSAELGEASPPGLPMADAQQPLRTQSGIPMARIASKHEAATETPVSQTESRGSSDSQTSHTMKPKRLFDYPKGHARLAEMQARLPNTGNFRRYDATTRRILIEDQAAISDIEQALSDLEEDEQDGYPMFNEITVRLDQLLERYSPAGRSAIPCHTTYHHDDPFDKQDLERDTKQQSRFKSNEALSQVYKDSIIDVLRTRMTNYYGLALRFDEIIDKPRISDISLENIKGLLRDYDVFDAEVLEVLNQAKAKDFFTMRGVRSCQPFENLLYQYNQSRFMRVISDCFTKVFGIKDEEATDPHHAVFRSDVLLKLQRALVAFIYGAILLTPVAILYLVPMSKASSLAVVVAFKTLFLIILTLDEFKLDTMLFALCAYIAVLVAFLSNSSQGCAQ